MVIQELFISYPDAEIQKEYEIRLEADKEERERTSETSKAQKDITADGSNKVFMPISEIWMI